MKKSVEKMKSKQGEAYRLSFASVHKRDVDDGGIFIAQKSHKEIRTETRAFNKLTEEEQKEERLRKRRETRKIYDSLSLEVEYDYSPPEGYSPHFDGQKYIEYTNEKPKTNYLQVKIGLRKAKIRPLCNDDGIKNRSI